MIRKFYDTFSGDKSGDMSKETTVNNDKKLEAAKSYLSTVSEELGRSDAIILEKEAAIKELVDGLREAYNLSIDLTPSGVMADSRIGEKWKKFEQLIQKHKQVI